MDRIATNFVVQRHATLSNRVFIVRVNRPTYIQVLAGLEDGGVCAWDLREPVHPHREVQRQVDGSSDAGNEWLIRSPTFVTTCDDSHTSRVTSIKALPASDDGLSGLEDAVAAGGSLPIFQGPML
jgi:hypothetical protein